MKPTTRRRNTELALGLLAVLITGFGYLLVQLADKPDLPPDLWAFLGIVVGLYRASRISRSGASRPTRTRPSCRSSRSSTASGS